ncbi:hypothetical protein [Streptomyces sp. NPDC088719]|uniref:hypothetical protein n=1 Tax=Streptomyces sp. NPDC088719 TaxID=3365872 RepID=UPI003820B626
MPTNRRKPSGFVSLLLLLAGVLLFWLTVPNLGNAARAATADGPRGTFTAARLVCAGHSGHTTCEWSGTFQSLDGTQKTPNVKLYGSDQNTFKAGQTAPAVDVGNPGRVYDPDGTHTWIVTLLLALLAYALLITTAHRHLAPPTTTPQHTPTGPSQPRPADAPPP